MQLEVPAQPKVLAGGECALLTTLRRKFPPGLRRHICFHKKFLDLTMGYIQVKNVSLEKKPCPSVLII